MSNDKTPDIKPLENSVAALLKSNHRRYLIALGNHDNFLSYRPVLKQQLISPNDFTTFSGSCTVIYARPAFEAGRSMFYFDRRKIEGRLLHN